MVDVGDDGDISELSSARHSIIAKIITSGVYREKEKSKGKFVFYL
jgi:hypothetical protein